MTHAQLPAADLMKLVNQAREDYAREILDIARVAGLMKDRATKGFDWLQVEQTKPVRLQGTRAAIRLIRWLARGGCRIDWRDMAAREGDPMVRHYQHAELCIYWSNTFDQISQPAHKWLADSGQGRISEDDVSLHVT